MANLTSWRGRGEIDRLRNDMDKMFDDLVARGRFSDSYKEGDWTPAVDMLENEKEILVHFEITGMDVKDLDISLNGRVLTIKGEKKQEKVEKEKHHHFIERRYGSFSRSLELPADVDADHVNAKYKDGVLTLNLPKTKKVSFKKIEVKT